MKEYLNKWSYKRLIQLVIGLYFFWEYSQHPVIFTLILGIIISMQAIFNIGCFSTRGCSTNLNEIKKEDFIDEIEFKEIK